MTFFSSNTKLANFFKHTQVPGEATQFGRDASADWRALCISFLVFILGAITVSVVVYWRVDKEDIFPAAKKEPTSPLSLDRLKLERTVLFYEKKHEQFEALKRRPLSTVDPYIPRLQEK